MLTRFGQYIGPKRLPAAPTRPHPAPEPTTAPPATPARTPTAIQLAEPVATRLQGLVHHATSHDPVEGLQRQADIIDRGLRELLTQLRHELDVGEQFPTPSRRRAPRGRPGGAWPPDADPVQITVKFNPALLAQARAALWYLRETDVPTEHVYGIGSLNEMVTVATDRLLRTLEKRHHDGTPWPVP